ncbi:hypothetical protein M413DRAFT_238636 [Hebeloma cylindrosporum]|uniref:Uncharacterized protein n=1 Tax=Hebeloma cylindrosporum TaxID=76867 RepID=A0A0C2XMA9_HEBCY|nr:hypothetical protein M413DRAFT_238636 [Hebeloma cylindrosporum h7]
MITMAAVTMFFLPGTFVSALFSMVFFDTKANDNGSESISVGPQWWLFPVITIPLTILVFATWVAWQRYRSRVDSESLGISDLMKIAGPDMSSEKSSNSSYQGRI